MTPSDGIAANCTASWNVSLNVTYPDCCPSPVHVVCRIGHAMGMLLTVLLTTNYCFAQSGMHLRAPNTSLRIDLTSGTAPPAISESGLYIDIGSKTIAPGIIPYGVNAPLWSDGAHKTRYMALPGDSRIEFSRDGDWGFPPNSVLVKNFHLDLIADDGTMGRQIVETRLLVKVGDTSQWQGFSYLWDEEARDAQLLTSGRVETYAVVDPADSSRALQLDYLYPAPEDCGRCHTYGAGQILGARTSQMNGSIDYDGVVAHQLEALNSMGLFTEDIGIDFAGFPRLSDPSDLSEPITARARSYLQANCAHCHLPGGLRRTEIDLRFATPLEEMGILDEPSDVDDLGSSNRRLLKPGEPDNSVLLLRTSELGRQRMPPLATGVVDPLGTGILRAWILSLGSSTAVAEDESLPHRTGLFDSYPNPFNAVTIVRFELVRASAVRLELFDVMGRRVRELAKGWRAAGRHSVEWDGRGSGGESLATGIYLARLTTDDAVDVRRLSLIK